MPVEIQIRRVFLMADIKIHVFHTGEVCVAPDLPFGGDNSNTIKASGVFGKKEDRLKVHVCAADLSVTDAALDVFDFCLEHKLPVDILVNNAGFGDAGAFADRDWQKQYEMVQVNIVALMQLTYCFLKPMMEQGYGKILNLSSVAAFSALPGR